MTALLPVRDVPTAHRDRRLLSLVASACALGAAAIHAAVVPEHLEEVPAAGVFFVVLAAVQLALAVALLRPLQPGVLVVAVVGHLGVVVLYVASRTTDLGFLPAHRASHLPVATGVGDGVPVLPGAHAEPVGVLDVACLVLELVLVTMLAALLPARAARLVTDLLGAVALSALVARVLGILG